MYKEIAESLLRQVMDTAQDASEPTIDSLSTRPVFFLAPQSHLGLLFAGLIAAGTPHLVAVIDDQSGEAGMHGVPRWSSAEFLQWAARFPGAVAIDFSAGPIGRAHMAELTRRAKVERQDCMVAQGQLGIISIYQTVSEYRQKTLHRLDDFLRLAGRFADDHSRATLYANLLTRLTYDRSHMLATWANPADEYFSAYASPTSFQLGSREHYCDCGAYQGPIVSKLLGATGHRYASITAFEPDRANFEALKSVSLLPLSNFRPVNKAVSNRQETLRFKETGTMSSCVSDTGSVSVQTARLDDELDLLTFLKMDVEGYEPRVLEGARRLITDQRPRIAACVYHYAEDLLDVMAQIDQCADDYHLRLRQHNGSYFFDLILYASPVAGVEAPAIAA